jgi:uncharacterized protein (TIGR02118 family)
MGILGTRWDQRVPIGGRRDCEETVTMIRFSVLYPRTEGATFDHDYYRDKHIPMASAMWGISGVEIDRGLDGPYVAAAHFRFASIEEMKAAMSRGDQKAIVADVANYTTIAPLMQTSEVTG